MAWSFVLTGKAAAGKLIFVDLISRYTKDRRVPCTPTWGQGDDWEA